MEDGILKRLFKVVIAGVVFATLFFGIPLLEEVDLSSIPWWVMVVFFLILLFLFVPRGGQD